MAVQTTKASEVADLTQDPTDNDKVLGYNANKGAGMFSFTRLFNWLKTKTADTITANDKTPVNSNAVNGALTNYIPLSNLNGNNITITYTSQLSSYDLPEGGNGFIISITNIYGLEYIQLCLGPLSNAYEIWNPPFSLNIRIRNPSNNQWGAWKTAYSISPF